MADEDLGGGMKGLAKFEWNVDTTDNIDASCSGTVTTISGTTFTKSKISCSGTPFSARDSWVGLKGGFGTVRLGRSGSPYKQSGVALDPFVTTSLEARNNFGMSGNADGHGVLTAHNSFVSEGLFYTSPEFVGLSVDAYVGLDGTGSNVAAVGNGNQGSQTNGDLSVALRWKGGPINAFVAYNKAANVVTTAALAPEPTAMKVGGQVKLAKMHTISFQYEKTDRTTARPTTPTRPITSSSATSSSSATPPWSPRAACSRTAVAIHDGTQNQEATYYALGAIYNFSKTFRVFGGYRATELENEVVGVNTVRDDNVITVGMRKDF
jgi:predicted porin